MAERVLIVDDSVDNRKLLMKTLVRAGYEAFEAGDGREALAVAGEILPDLILLDIMMPGMDGYEACTHLKDNPLLSDVPIIFLSAKSEIRHKIKGLEIGAADYIAKPFDRGEVLARVQSQLRIRSLMKELIEKQRRLDEDLHAAAGIQRSLLPAQAPEVEGWDIAWHFTPSDLIGGDIFNVFQLNDDHLGLYMLDVSGRGVPAALVTVSVSQMLMPHMGVVRRRRDRVHGDVVISPGAVMRQLAREYPLERFDKFFSIVYGVLNVREGRLIYSNAGHPLPVVVGEDGRLELLDKGGPVIGLGDMVPFEEGEVLIRPGDKLVFYTDGIIEARDDKGGLFRQNRLQEILLEGKSRPASILLNEVIAAVLQFCCGSKALADDISLLAVERLK